MFDTYCSPTFLLTQNDHDEVPEDVDDENVEYSQCLVFSRLLLLLLLLLMPSTNSRTRSTSPKKAEGRE